MHMIELKNIQKAYGDDLPVLDDVNIDIDSGEFVSVTGRSGAGKSTIMKLLMAAEKPTAGTVHIGGWDISDLSVRDVPKLRRQIGVVFQDFKLLPKMTVKENIAFALEVCGTQRGKIRGIVKNLLKLVDLPDTEDRFPVQLSGGEQQRVVIARALVHQPKLLIADEPTGNLDTVHSKEIIDLLKKINSFGTTVVLITHNREIVNDLKRRVITLERGHVISDQKKGRYIL